MTILDNPMAPSAAASEPPAALLDGIEIPAEGAAEQLPIALTQAIPEHVPDAPAEDSPSAAAPTSALSASADGEEAPAAASVLEPSAEQSAQKQRGRPFEPGQSGNPNGRPKGARNRVTRAVEALIDGQGEALGAKAVEKALQGDSTMLRALLSTLVPPRRERTVEFELPKIESAADALKASSAVISACAAGELSPHEASEIMGLISTHARAIEVAELEARVAALEKKQSSLGKKGIERWRELKALEKFRGILTQDDANELHDLESQPDQMIRAELARERAERARESERCLRELRAEGVIK
jgi:Family of unknown function (DUF5681)